MEKKNCKLAASSCGSSCISPQKTCTLKSGQAPILNSLTAKVESASEKLRRRAAEKDSVQLKDYFDPQLWVNTFGKSVDVVKNNIPALTDFEAAAVHQWTSSSYRAFNDKLVRKDPNAKPMLASFKSAMAKLESPSPENIKKEHTELTAKLKGESAIKSYNLAERFMTLNPEARQKLTKDNAFSGISAFSYLDSGDNPFSYGANTVMVLKHKGGESSGKLIDRGKNDLQEGEIVFMPNPKFKIAKVSVGKNSYSSIEEAKADESYETGKMKIFVVEE